MNNEVKSGVNYQKDFSGKIENEGMFVKNAVDGMQKNGYDSITKISS